MPDFADLATDDPEAALAALERQLGLVITVRDLSGWLRAADGRPIIDPARNSHQRQAVCAHGFERTACVQHCRQLVGEALRRGGPGGCSTRCWKGVREVLVPVLHGRSLHGYLFAGAWRAEACPAGPWQAAWHRLPPWDPVRARAVAALLRLLADGLWQAGERARMQAAPADRAASIRAFIRANPLRGRSGLARHLGLSPSRTSHAVREACGISLQRLVIEERLAAAQALLADSDLPVAEVGARVGWGDPPHFARMFRRLTGLPPGTWRDRHRLA